MHAPRSRDETQAWKTVARVIYRLPMQGGTEEAILKEPQLPVLIRLVQRVLQPSQPAGAADPTGAAEQLQALLEQYDTRNFDYC